jgi:SAM-dependent methyltransferase
MLTEAKEWWEQHGRDFQEKWCRVPIDVLYGTGCPNEEELQLIGPVAGKRVLEIGCGGAQCSIAFAKAGAQVTAVDVAASEIAFARELAEKHAVDIGFHQRDMSDLLPIADGTQDIAFSSSAFQYVDDLDVCFGEVFRVLKGGGLFVWGMGHPMQHVVDTRTMAATRSYSDTGPHIEGAETGCAFASVHRTISDYFNLMVDAGFAVERMLEPDSRQRYASDPWFGLWGLTAEYLAIVPGTLIFRARKPKVLS